MSQKSKVKKLQKACEKMWKEACIARDGRKCKVKEYITGITHTEIIQVDHCFSRSIKALFLDVSNGTVVCSGCNMQKNFSSGIDKIIDKIVRDREGVEKFDLMLKIALEHKPFKDFTNIEWLTSRLDYLTKTRDMYLSRKLDI